MVAHISESYILNQLKSTFTDFDISLFKFNFNLHTLKKNSNDKFIINLYNIYSHIGFSRKSDAKKLLVNKFTENKDYIIAIKHSGTIPEQILLTIDCFKMFCLTASTKNARNVYNYYIKIDEIINNTKPLNDTSPDLNISTSSKTYNISNDDILINLIKQKFNKDDMEIFELNFKIYLANENNKNDYTIDLEDIYKWLGFSTKGNAKRFLFDKFIINKHYTIINTCCGLLLPTEKQSAPNLVDATQSKHNKEKIMLNIETFKKFCMKASTNESEKFLDYYITMEIVIFDYIKLKINEHIELNYENSRALEIKNKQLEDKDNIIKLQAKQLEDQTIELKQIKNQTYEEINKSEYIYVFSTDKDNIYKCGRTKEINKRKDQLQTACVDDIIELFKYETSNNKILESIIHYILQNYRCHSNREHFRCNINYIKLIINVSGIFLDTLKSTYEYITFNELLDKLYTKLKHELHINEDIKINIPNQIVLIEEKLNDTCKSLTNENQLNTDINLTSNKITYDTDDICNWLLKNYTKTNIATDIIKFEKIYELFIRSEYYNNLANIEKLKIIYEYFILRLQNCKCLKNYIIKQYIHKTFILIKFKYKINNISLQNV